MHMIPPPPNNIAIVSNIINMAMMKKQLSQITAPLEIFIQPQQQQKINIAIDPCKVMKNSANLRG